MRRLNILVSIWFGIVLMTSSAQGQIMSCRALFNDAPVIAPHITTETPKTSIEVLAFAKNNQALKETLQKLPDDRKDNIENLLASVEFFDYRHTADLILNNFFSNQKGKLDLTNRYDHGEMISGTPFYSFLSARTFLEKSNADLTVDLLVQTHRLAMDGEVSGMMSENLGVIRDTHVAGKSTLRIDETNNINSNDYLIFQKDKGEERGVFNNRFWDRLKIWGVSAKKYPVGSLNLNGKIQYPNIATIKRPLLDLVKERDPELYGKILIFHQEVGPRPENHPLFHRLQQKFITLLLEHRLEVFHHEKDALGPIELGINERHYIDMVADLQRDLVAIHPFKDGNGRTTRLIMNYLLTKEGLPPARILEPDVDIQISREAWRKQVQQGVFNNAQLRADIMYRLKNGMLAESSPALLYPNLKETLSAPADSAQFNAFIKTLFDAHPEIRQEMKENSMQTLARLNELFVDYYRSKTVVLQKQKNSEKVARLRLVDPDFIDSFGINRSGNKELWQNKINRWYTQQLVWRGVSSRQHVYTTEQLLSYFKAPSMHMASNKVLGKVREGHLLETAIKEDFKKYNQDLISGDLSRMADDHHATGPLYNESYGFSTSHHEGIGKAFAMGAMVIAKFGQHNTPEMQAKLKSRINVGTYSAFKDVDLAQLKHFDPRFEYKYGRQAEVMGIGGADPDSVMIVQRIDANGVVTETLVRNLEKPSEVLLVEGHYTLTDGPVPQERIKQRYNVAPENPQLIPSAWKEKAKGIFNKLFHR